MSNLAIVPQANALTMQEEEVLPVLKSSLYPGAEDASIKLVLGYCRAAGLDPMQKPVHIVPMRVKTGTDPKGKPTYAMRDVIMPGVGLYRTQAARSGQLLGITEPEFGPMIDMEFSKKVWEDGEPRTIKKTLQFPDWCRVTVKRAVVSGGHLHVAEFTATEYWLENYATAGKDSEAPNEMWAKRPRGQLAKCAQAQALRMAFPEMTGAAPTADEMAGKTIDDDEIIEHAPIKAAVKMPERAKAAKVEDPRKMPHVEHPDQGPGPQTEPASEPELPPAPAAGEPHATTGEMAYLARKFTEAKLDLVAACNERGWNSQLLTKNQFGALKSLAIDTINQAG